MPPRKWKCRDLCELVLAYWIRLAQETLVIRMVLESVGVSYLWRFA